MSQKKKIMWICLFSFIGVAGIASVIYFNVLGKK